MKRKVKKKDDLEDKIINLKRITQHWARFSIVKEGIIRYGVKTDNWAESQNAAFDKKKSRSVLGLLIHTFRYTCTKIEELKEHAEEIRRNNLLEELAERADKIYKENLTLKEKCTGRALTKKKWIVNEEGATYTVVIRTMNNVSCDCHRYYDELIPCQHILFVYDRVCLCYDTKKLIPKFYRKSQFVKAFPADDSHFYYPDDACCYSCNPDVIHVVKDVKPGAPETLRHPRANEKGKHKKRYKKMYLTFECQIYLMMIVCVKVIK